MITAGLLGMMFGFVMGVRALHTFVHSPSWQTPTPASPQWWGVLSALSFMLLLVGIVRAMLG